MRRVALLLMVIFTQLAWYPARAVIIDPSQSAGAVPGVAGTGLSGSYYKFAPSITFVTSLTQANQLMTAAGSPTATFISNTVCFPDCSGSSVADTTSLSTLLNGNVSNFSYVGTNTSANTTTIDHSAMVLTGYIAIAQAGSYTFHLGSDDGSELIVGGQAVILDDGVHSFSTVAGSASFAAAGLYAISIEYFENNGSTGLDFWASNDATGNCFVGRNANCGGMAATTSLYSTASGATAAVPEPPSFMLFLVALLALGLVARRHRA